MTQDEMESSESEAEVTTSDTVTTVDGVSTETVFIDIRCEIDQTYWDAALADSEDALVLVQWLESKRADADDD